MTHPSIQGLREAVAEALRVARCDHAVVGLVCAECSATAALQAQAAYLTEHGVLLSGEGLVRADAEPYYDAAHRLCARPLLVPVPQDAEEG